MSQPQLFKERTDAGLDDGRIGVAFERKITDRLIGRPAILEPIPDESRGRVQGCDLIARHIENGGPIGIDNGTKGNG
jgi:hypothetical protein